MERYQCALGNTSLKISHRVWLYNLACFQWIPHLQSRHKSCDLNMKTQENLNWVASLIDGVFFIWAKKSHMRTRVGHWDNWCLYCIVEGNFHFMVTNGREEHPVVLIQHPNMVWSSSGFHALAWLSGVPQCFSAYQTTLYWYLNHRNLFILAG